MIKKWWIITYDVTGQVYDIIEVKRIRKPTRYAKQFCDTECCPTFVIKLAGNH